MENFSPKTTDETPETNPSGQAGNSVGNPTSATLDAAGKALDSVVEPRKNRGGRPPTHGLYVGGRKPKKSDLKKVPLGEMGQSPLPLLVDEDEVAPVVSSAPSESKPDFRAIAEQYADPLLDLLAELSAGYQRWKVFRATKSAEVADLIANENQNIPDSSRKLMRSGLIETAAKHEVDLSKSPETTLLGGFAIWQMKVQQGTKKALEVYLSRQQNKAA